MAPRGDASFPELLATVRALRNDARACSGVPFARLSLVQRESGEMELFTLGALAGQQSLLGGRVSSSGCSLTRLLQPLAATSSPALSLLAERLRSATVSGVSDMSMTSEGNAVLAAGDQVLRVSAGRCTGTVKMPGVVLEAQQCPCNSSLAAVACDGRVYILHHDSIIYSTPRDNEDIYFGTPSFITQEEMGRFSGMWWSPSERRLLYECVDENSVHSVFVSTRQAPMKYPLAGTPNTVSELRLLHIVHDKRGFPREVLSRKLRIPLSRRFSWFEYLARADFMTDGITVWAVLMNREQTRSAVVLLPENEWEGLEDSEAGCVQQCTVAYEEASNSWINTHNLTAAVAGDASCSWHLVHGVETATDCRLLLLSANSQPRLLTAGPWSVNKTAGLFVDSERAVVYFFANYHHPTETNFCAATLRPVENVECAPLTEQHRSCRVDRAMRSASMCSGKAFVCWLSSLKHAPYCAVYSLVHDPLSLLPTANFLCKVELQSWHSCLRRSPVDDEPRLLSFHSAGSGLTHYALLHLPRGSPGPFPVVHFVYGGPGVQLVKNEWASWTHLQKFAALGYAVVVVDGRGSDNRGRAFESPLKHQLGGAELADQVEGLLAVSSLAPGQLDLTRVAIHGWSYGGFLSVLALARRPDLYRCAVAGGTVVDWSLYDTAYTERYLGLSIPAYRSSSLEQIIASLPDDPGRLMLAHGLQDENVHFAHVEKLIEMLITAGKPYHLQLFPSERHGLRSLDASAHFDASFFAFIAKAFRVELPSTMPPKGHSIDGE